MDKNNRVAVGTRVIYTTHPGGDIQSGTIREYAPSGNFVGISWRHEAAWYAVGTLNILEELPAEEIPPSRIMQLTSSETTKPAISSLGGNADGNTGGEPGTITETGALAAT